MQIKVFRSMWGMSLLPLEANFKKIKESGFQGTEFVEHELAEKFDDSEVARIPELLREYDLEGVPLIPTFSTTPEDDIVAFTQQYHDLIRKYHPSLFLSHTGRDFYTLEQNLQVIEAIDNLVAQKGVKVVHETHRGRFGFSPQSTAEAIRARDSIRLNADFSHWCCVCESYLEEQEEAVELAIEHTDHIHARVGHPEGPQVSDPRSPEWGQALEEHMGWWERIIQANEKRGTETLIITPEFGPDPYMPLVPFTCQPLGNLWDITVWMKDELLKRFGRSPAKETCTNAASSL